MVVHLSNYIGHVVETGRLPCQESGRLDGAFCENGFGVRRVAEGHYLVLSREYHIVLSHNGAAADGLDADFFSVTFFLFVLLSYW